MNLQSLPPSSAKYSAAQLATIEAAVQAVSGKWSSLGPRFDTGWSIIGPSVVASVTSAQQEMVTRAAAYIPAVLQETGQGAAADAIATPETSALVGYTGSGQLVSELLAGTTIRAKQAVGLGQTPRQAINTAGQWLSAVTQTVLADTARGGESLETYVRTVHGYVRMVHGGACGRCVVLAGKWFRTNQGFLRHPLCKCTHIPAAENIAGDLTTDPDAYFHSLTTEQQIKLMGSKANAQAVHDGADIGQLVNAYRASAGMSFAQVSPIKTNKAGDKFTTEGTTRRGVAAQQQTALRRNGPSQLRLMPETIARIAKSDADRMRLLKLYGWVRDDDAISRGRALFAEQRRADRNARARARRAEARATS